MEDNLKEIKEEIENMSFEELQTNLKEVENILEKIEKIEEQGGLYQNE